MATKIPITKTGLSEKIADITKCSICLETMKDPKQLPCIHTFCLQCLQALDQDKKSENEISCPVCRKQCSIPVGGIEKLTTNFFMIQLIEVNKLESENETKSTRCELCSEPDHQIVATSFCLECSQHFCDQCSLVHKKMKISKNHEIVNAKDIPRVEERIKMAISYCELHPKEEVKLFCNDCNIATCFMCYVENHNKHECSDIRKCAAKFSEQLNDDIEKVVKCASAGRVILDQLEMNKKKLIEKVDSTEKNISKGYNNLIALVKSHRSRLIQELNSLKKKTLKEMDIRKDEVERHIAIMESHTRYSREMKDRGTACDISRAANDLHVRAEELIKSHEQQGTVELVQVDFMFTPLSTDTDKNLIGELTVKGVTTTSTGDVESRSIQAKKDNESTQLTTALFSNKHTLNSVRRMSGLVYGITVLGSDLYVVQDRSSCHVGSVDVYCTESFTKKSFATIHGSKSLHSIASCEHNKCLYLSDIAKKAIYRYDIVRNDFIKHLKLSEASWGLSVSKETHNLLVTLHVAKFIEEYTYGGTLIRKINLDSSVHFPHHSVHLTGDQFVVCYGQNKSDNCGVAIVDSDGRIIRSYKQHSRSGAGLTSRPYRIAVDSHHNVLVLDFANNRIELLSPTLTHRGYIQMSTEQQYKTSSLYLDEANKVLYVTQGTIIYRCSTI